MSVLGAVLVRIFLHLDWIRRDKKYLSVYLSECGKTSTRKTSNTDTFQQWSSQNKLTMLDQYSLLFQCFLLFSGNSGTWCLMYIKISCFHGCLLKKFSFKIVPFDSHDVTIFQIITWYNSWVYYKIDVQKKFVKFTEKHLCQISFFNEVAG